MIKLNMDKGTVLFDGVTISNTEAAEVRVGGQRWVLGGCAWVVRDGRGVGRSGCLGCVQRGGGVVDMGDGVVIFKGGTITNTKAVRSGHMLHVSCSHAACCPLHVVGC